MEQRVDGVAPKKVRLDLLLLERGLAQTRQKAQALILSGNVKIDGTVCDKSGSLFAPTCAVEVIGPSSKYVGRGGDKIEPMFDYFQIEVSGRIAVDVGASTGGFTDCLLQLGAARVYAVDVGHHQLDFSLRTDPRVIVMEDVNARFLSSADFNPKPSLAVVDVSFISLRLILEPILNIMERDSILLMLVKPQFELEPRSLSKGGVVKDEADQLRAVDSVANAGKALGLNYLGFAKSPLKGLKKGNQEYFVCFTGAFSL